MILLQNITENDLKFKNDINECLVHNMSNYQIEEIIIFSDIKDIDIKIGLDKNSKKVVLMKIDCNHLDIIKYGKKKSKDYIIYSTPFIKFNDVSSIMQKVHMDSILIEPHSYYIFRKDVGVCNGKTIDDILLGSKIKSSLNLQRFGYFAIPNFPIKSIGWDITRNYKEDIVLNKSVPPKVDIIVEKVLVPEKIIVEKVLVPEKIQVAEKIKGPKRVGDRKIDVVIVSVNYNDFLLISLENNSKIFENITVVTSSSDFLCQKICKKFDVKCVVTDIMYEDGSVFNKGKAINAGIGSISDPDYILLLDADILVMDKIYLDSLDDEFLYTADRHIVADYDSYQRYISDGLDKDDEFILDVDKGLGFFQLFNSYMRVDYPESSKDASLCDIIFRDKFDKRTTIDNTILHLGNESNWKGRKSKAFLDDFDFSLLLEKEIDKSVFDINTYFDRIYCINLPKRTDRWEIVNREFESNGILAERFLAIDKIDSRINSEVNQDTASKLGILENGGALGCLLSHLSLIKNAKDKGYKRILIFEDDVVFSKDFNERISEICTIDWKMLYLGASQFEWNSISPKNGFYNCKKTLGTFAYCVDSSIYDDLIILLSSKIKSVDNYFADFQIGRKDCHVFYPNIVVSMVSDSDIRNSKNIFEYSKVVKWDLSNFDHFKRVLLVPDVKDWAFDNIANAIVKYNPYPDRISYEIEYVREMLDGKIIDIDRYEYVYVFFEAERIIPDSPKVIRGCYSAFWLENKGITPKLLGEYFSNCKASIFANDYLRDSISPYLPDGFSTTIIHDSADENVFYPIRDKKNDNFTVIFVGNTKRPVKRFLDIVHICKEADVELIVCSDIKNSDLVNYYNKADVCINFSDFEGGPQTFLESSLCEVPMLIKSNNELSKIVPCFTGSTKEEFINILIALKKNRRKCSSLGKKAKEVVLEKFTYSDTAKKFADFFLNIDGYGKVDLTKELTVFIIRSGENPNYKDCLNSLNNQNVDFILKEIIDIAPMSKAFQKMIDDCDTEYYIQVDEDMVLLEDSISKIYHSMLKLSEKTCSISFRLLDKHLNFNIYGIKGYKHNILKKYPYNLNIISCEVEQLARLQKDGYDMVMNIEVVGYHSPKWTAELIFERYFDLMEKWKIFRYDWLSELPYKLVDIYSKDPSEINFYALMGAMSSVMEKEPIRKSEKNFKLKNPIFENIENMTQPIEFKHILLDEYLNEEHWINFVEKEQVLNKGEMRGKF